ncbi:MAG: PaRep2b protein [Thermoproteus sp.]
MRLAALRSLNELLPGELRFGVHTYVKEGRYYSITATGEDAARLKRILAVTAPSAGGRYLSPKFDGLVEEAQVDVRLGGIRRTERGVAADLTISEGGIAVKYNVYLHNEILLQFRSTDRGRVELAARLLRLAGVDAEVKKVGGEDVWYVKASTNKLAAGRKELRDAIADIVEAAARNVGEETAKRWLEDLKRGITLREGWPRYLVRLVEGALEVRYETTNSGNIEREARRLKAMGLVEGVHFSVRMPEGGRRGYVSILKEGLAYAAFLSVYGKDEEQRSLAAGFVERILQRAEEAGDDVRKKAEEIVEEGKARGSLRLKGFEKEFEVNGVKYKVKVIGGEAVEEDRGGRKLLRIKIKAEVGRVEGEHIVDPVVREYTITFGRYGANAAVGYAVARADAPGGREADAERFSALIKALTGKEPKVYRRSNGKIMLECGEGHLEGFMRYAELADAIARRLAETGSQ